MQIAMTQAINFFYSALHTKTIFYLRTSQNALYKNTECREGGWM